MPAPTAQRRSRRSRLALVASQIDQLNLELVDRQEQGLEPTSALLAARNEHLGYTLLMLSCSLPHTEPKTNTYTRSHGRHQVHIAAHPNIGLPYGAIPRLLIPHIFTEVRRTKSATIQLGRNLTEVADRLAISDDGASFRRYKDILRRALSASYQFSIAPGPDDPVTRFRNLSIATSGAINLESEDWFGTITVSADLLTEILAHSFPLYVSLLRELMRSPLSMDLYAWLAHQTYITATRQIDVTATFKELEFLFGADYASTKEFARYLRRELEVVLDAVPGWIVRPVLNGLVVKPGKIHVPPATAQPKLRLLT